MEGPVAELIGKINKTDACVVSIDVPSGVNGLTGEVGGVAVEADITGTMAFVKRGLLLYPGRFYAGDIVVIDIGVPYELPFEPGYRLLDEEEFYLPFKIGNEHKGKNGKLLIIAGSKNYTGAPALCADAAQRIGAGLVYLLVPEDAHPIVASKLKDPVVVPYRSPEEIEKYVVEFDPHGVLFGPGVGRSESTVRILKMLLEKNDIPLVIDADGIWALSQVEIHKRDNVAITPHPGEAAFLTGESAGTIDRNRFDIVEKLREQTGYSVVLKGNPTVISTSYGNFVNISGNEGLGKGGSGDVLSGFIGGLLVQTHDIENSLLAGVYIHALLGDILYEEMNGPYYVPHDLLDNLHLVFEAFND